MKVRKPYEILIRFALDGSVSGAHFKEQSYYTDDAGNPDIATWREEPPQPADVQSPATQALLAQSGASLTQQFNDLQARAAAAEALAAEQAQQLAAAQQVIDDQAQQLAAAT